MTTANDQRSYRLDSIDMLRGLVIIIMALDHCRDYFMAGGVQNPMADPNVSIAVFATRWITHFCAPVFVLLAGTSAGLMLARKSPQQLARFLFTRGLWLIFIEIVVISVGWTFTPVPVPAGDAAAHLPPGMPGHFIVIFQVIWALGASMVVLAGAQFLGRNACLALGAAVVLGHNLLDPVWPAVAPGDVAAPLWLSLHAGMARPVGPFFVFFAYPLLPWIGVMLLGFGASRLFERPAAERQRLLLVVGTALCLAFLVVRGIDVYGEPKPWSVQDGGLVRTIMSFINTTKYPPSLDYLLMTLGPAAIVLALADRITGIARGVLLTFGRVPFAFYVAHIYLIHFLSLVLGVAMGFDAMQFVTIFMNYPKGYGLPLPGVYAGWILVVLMLYPLCQYVAGLKARRRDWWLSYV